MHQHAHLTIIPQGMYQPQEQYRTPPNNRPPNMAVANFVVITTNGEGACALNGTAVAAVFIDQ